ncbi:MAG: AI-2E family transporter [Rickettsiales bacterium]|nr:AI-2E family transporter [Rickettsiales bacterium]
MLFYNKQIDIKKVVTCILFLVSIIILYIVRDVLTPFLLGVIFSYAFKNFTNKMELKYGNRRIISMGVVIFFWTVLTILFIYAIPFLIRQTISIGNDVIVFFENNSSFINQEINKYTKYINVNFDVNEYASSYLKDFDTYLDGILSTSIRIFNAIYIFIMTPITMYYFLNDWNMMIKFLKKYLFFLNTKKMSILFRGIDIVLTACIKEQFYVCFLLGLFYSILLFIIGLNYSFAIGMIGGFATFIPYVGIIIATLVAIIMTLYQFGSQSFYLISVATIFISGLLIEMNFLLPKIVGRKINLHPLWVIFSLVVGGALMGFYGLLFALPIASVIGVLIRFYFKK